jgi:hypothetical protein
LNRGLTFEFVFVAAFIGAAFRSFVVMVAAILTPLERNRRRSTAMSGPATARRLASSRRSIHGTLKP